MVLFFLCSIASLRLVLSVVMEVWHCLLGGSHALVLSYALIIEVLILIWQEVLLTDPNIGDMHVLLKHHHLVNSLLLQIHVLLLHVSQTPWIINAVLTQVCWLIRIFLILESLLIVELPVVDDVLTLEVLDNLLEGSALGLLLDVQVWKFLLWQVSVIKVDTHVLVPHLKVSSEGWVSHDFLIVFLGGVVDFITVEHGYLLDVLQSGL